MIALDPLHLVAAAMLCGVLAAWLLGVALYVRFLRQLPDTIRSHFRVLLPMQVDHAMGHVVVGINHSPHFIASLTGRLEGVLTASIRPTNRRSKTDAAQLACRVEDFGSETQLRVRLDFSPVVEQTRRRLQLLVVALWPAWIGMVTVAVTAALTTAESPGTWWALNLLHGIYPLVAVIALVSNLDRTRSLLYRAVGSVVENLRFLPHHPG
jgi:hypothetical protein